MNWWKGLAICGMWAAVPACIYIEPGSAWMLGPCIVFATVVIAEVKDVVNVTIQPGESEVARLNRILDEICITLDIAGMGDIADSIRAKRNRKEGD